MRLDDPYLRDKNFKIKSGVYACFLGGYRGVKTGIKKGCGYDSTFLYKTGEIGFRRRH